MKVKFNNEKTELLNFIHGHKQMQSLSFGNSILEEKLEHKHLGRNNGKWDSHI